MHLAKSSEGLGFHFFRYTHPQHTRIHKYIVVLWIFSELKKSNGTYSEKLQSNKYSEKDLINLSWKIKELGDLNEMGRSLHTEVNSLSSRLEAG